MLDDRRQLPEDSPVNAKHRDKHNLDTLNLPSLTSRPAERRSYASDLDEALWPSRRRRLLVRVVGLLPAVVGGLMLIGAGLAWLKAERIPLADRLAVLSAVATGILVVVTTIYVRITGNTLPICGKSAQARRSLRCSSITLRQPMAKQSHSASSILASVQPFASVGASLASALPPVSFTLPFANYRKFYQ
jgi:hypothetical protein